MWGLLPDLAGFACLYYSVRTQIRDSRPSATAEAGIAAAWVKPMHAALWSARRGAPIAR